MPRQRPNSTTPLRLEVLGAANRLVVPDQRSVLDIGKPLALITYLACAPNREASRDHLVDLLWSDLEPDAGRHALRQMHWYIKRRVNESLLSAKKDGYLGLTGPVAFDRDEFLAAVDGGNNALAVELYRRDFFLGFAAPGGAAFEQWADLERRRLRGLLYRAADSHCTDLQNRGRTGLAAVVACHTRDLDPLHQGGWRLLLTALIEDQDPWAALLELESLQRLVEQEETELEPATRAIGRIVRRVAVEGEALPRTTAALLSALVGREREFSVLLEAWESVRRGRGQDIHISAPAGLGKTRLLSDLQSRLRLQQARVVSIGSRKVARDVPYAMVSDLAVALVTLPGAKGVSPKSVATLVSMNPSLSSYYSASQEKAEEGELLRQRALALRELISSIAEEQPFALCIDDIHWADAESRAVVEQIASVIRTHRVLLVSAGRPAPAPRLESAGALLLELAPLNEEQVTEVVVSLAALPNDPWAQRFPAELWRATTGSPLWVLKTLQDFVNRSILSRESETWTTPAPQQVLAELKEGGAPRRLIENLDPSERWLTLVLALAGRPLDDTMLLALGGTSHETTHVNLDTLESRGIAIRRETEWQLTHEEISEAAIGAANADVVREVHAKLGREISERSPNSPRQVREAARHFVMAGDETSLQSAFSRFVLSMRSHGDHRAIALLASDLLGSDSSVDRVRRLTKSLPLHFRLGLTSGRRVAAALVAAVFIPISIAVISLAMLGQPARNAEAELTLISLNDESADFLADVPLFADEWIGGHPIQVSLPSRSARRTAGINLLPDRVAARPGGLEWVVSLPVADSGVNDLFLATRTGLRRRLTFGRGDDANPSWSPDGRFFVFATARWRSDSHYDLDIMDLRDGTTRALTRGDPTDRMPRWNPTGTTIAFLRHYWDGSYDAACVVAMDGNDIGRPAAMMSKDVGVSRCVRPQRGTLIGVLAWFDDETLVVEITEEQVSSVAFLHLANGVVSIIDRLAVSGGVAVSPDGRWVACLCERPGHGAHAWFVLPSTRPSESRPLLVESDDTGGAVTMVWAAPEPATAIDSVYVTLAAGAPRVGVPYQLQSVSRNRLGRVASAQPERWSSSDTSVATVDRWTGLLNPRGAGRTTVSVSLAGWREGASPIDIRPNDISTVFTEAWNAEIEPRWRPFGTPRPSIERVGGITAFHNNGDGTFYSGVFTAATFDASNGLFVSTRFSTPATSGHWQDATIGLAKDFDTPPTSAREDRGELLTQGNAACYFSYPAGAEGRHRAESAAAASFSEGEAFGAPAYFGTGQWYEVTIGVLPDGRCVVASEDRVLWVSPASENVSGSLRVFLQGNSVGSKILVSAVTVTTGVPERIARMLRNKGP